MNPQVSVSGGTLTAQKTQYVTRKYTTVVNLAASSKDVLASDLGLPDGCKVLKVVAKNLQGRSLVVTVPYDTPLFQYPSVGTASAAFGGIKKFASAPLSRFPVLKIQVPDLLASPLDSAANVKIFTLGSVIPNLTDAVELTFTVRYTL
jgi:hypothetical protein